MRRREQRIPERRGNFQGATERKKKVPPETKEAKLADPVDKSSPSISPPISGNRWKEIGHFQRECDCPGRKIW